MKRSVSAAVVMTVAASILAGCGGQSAYCEAVETDEATLMALATKKSNAEFEKYAKTFTEVSEVAPESVSADWSGIAEATQGVVAAHEEVGVALEELGDTEKVEALTPDQIAQLNEANEAFNDTVTLRDSVVKNVKQECGIELTPSS